jgi:predicted lipid-binding transport protein (Tim44 family)
VAAAALSLGLPASALAAAGGGTSSFGGGGGGGGSSGGSSFGGGSGGSGGDSTVALIGYALILLVFAIVVICSLVAAVVGAIRYRRRRQARRADIARASLAAAEDDSAFHPDVVRQWGEWLFREAQSAWDARDRARLARILGPDLMKEWELRLDDFDRKGWHNRVQVTEPVKVEYLGLVNRAEDAEDRAVVRVVATVQDYVIDSSGSIVKRNESDSTETTIREWWTLGKRDSSWSLLSIEQEKEGRHHLEDAVVATPADDDQRLADAAVVELAAADKVAEGFAVADVADLDFDGDARAAALDLSLADGRFAPAVLEAAARRVVAAWAEAVDGDDAALADVASPGALGELLHPGDPTRRTRLVVRGLRLHAVRIAALDAGAQPPAMTVELDVSGRRYVENRDTAAVVSGSQSAEARFSERWTLALDGPDDRPWRLVDAKAPPAAAAA